MFTLADGLAKVLPTKANAFKLLGRFNRRVLKLKKLKASLSVLVPVHSYQHQVLRTQLAFQNQIIYFLLDPSSPTQLVAGYFVGSVHFFRMYNAGKTVDVGDAWPETRKDLTATEWAHAVNSEAELKAALWGKTS